MAHVPDVDVLSGNTRPMSESLVLGRVGSLGGKKTYRFVDPDVVSGCPDDLEIMVDGCCQPSFSSTVKQMEQKVLDPFSNDVCISDPFYLSKKGEFSNWRLGYIFSGSF